MEIKVGNQYNTEEFGIVEVTNIYKSLVDNDSELVVQIKTVESGESFLLHVSSLQIV